MNKKIAIIPGITIIAIIAAVSQVNFEDVPEEAVEVERAIAQIDSLAIINDSLIELNYE